MTIHQSGLVHQLSGQWCSLINQNYNIGPHARAFPYSCLKAVLLFFIQRAQMNTPRQIQQTVVTYLSACAQDL